MPLFKKKKKEETIPEPPDFLEFPEVEQYTREESVPDFEEFESEPETRQEEQEQEEQEMQLGSEEEFTRPVKRIKTWERKEEGKVRKLPPVLTRELSKKSSMKPGTVRMPLSVGRTSAGKPAYKSLFIKVEKFREIVAGIQLISRKVAELEDIAQKIKETKAREDSEISDWEEQLAEIKARIERIESSLESRV